MIKIMCSVFDKKAACYSNPFYSPNIPVATRDFSAACFDKSSGISRNAEDYDLYQLGSFDDESGLLTANQPPVFICSASYIISNKEG